MNIDWDIIFGIDTAESLAKFLDKYHEHVDFNYKHDEFANTTFKYSYTKLKKHEKEHSYSDIPAYEGAYTPVYGQQVFEKIMNKDSTLFSNNYKLILHHDKDLFFKVYDKNKDNLTIQLDSDPNFTFEQFLKAESYNLIKDYSKFINIETDNKILSYILENKKIDIYDNISEQKKFKNNSSSLFGEDYLKAIIHSVWRSFSSEQDAEENKETSSYTKNILAKINILKQHTAKDKNFFTNPDSFFEMIKHIVHGRFNVKDVKNLTSFFINDDYIQHLDINILLADEFLNQFNFKTFNNCQKHFDLFYDILEKQNKVSSVVDYSKKLIDTYKWHYPEIIWMAMKKTTEITYENMIRENLQAVVEKNQFFDDKAYKYIQCFSDNIKKDALLVNEIKSRFSIDNDYNNYMTCSYLPKLELVFEQDNFMNLLTFHHSNTKKFDFMMAYIQGTSKNEINLIEQNSPKFYKSVFINKSGYINKYPVLKAALESKLIKEELCKTLNIDNSEDNKKQKRL